jgi:hypothetical protein
VTSANRAQYVAQYVRDALAGSVAARFRAFRAGFTSIGGAALSLFAPSDIGLLLSGNPLLGGLELLERSARISYVGYDRESPTIVALWRAVGALDRDEQRKLLQFWTGSSRVPILGLDSLAVRVQRDGSVEHLPSSHTCFNTLLLPPYGDDVALLLARLRVAIVHGSEGFFLR